MHPQAHQLVRILELSRVCQKQSLEDVRDVSEVELVVEIDSCLTEARDDRHVELEGCLDDGRSLFLHGRLETLQLSREEGVVDEEQRFVIGDRDGYRPEVALITRVDEERSRRRIHGSDGLRVDDVFQL